MNLTGMVLHLKPNLTGIVLEVIRITNVTGGDSLRDHQMYNLIKEIYITKGINSAITLSLYYLDSTDAYEMMRIIGAEVEGEKAENQMF